MSTTRQEAKTFAGSYAFSPPNMFAFLKALLERGCLPKSEAWRVIGIHTEDSYRQYESFLRSGGFVEADDSQVWPTAALKTLWQSLVRDDTRLLLQQLLRIPSFKLLYDYLCEHRVAPAHDPALPVSGRAKPTYVMMGEAAGAWLDVTAKGIAVTDNSPSIEQFARQAVEVYDTLKSEGDSERVLTGRWLEELALQKSIHPISARDSLLEARNEKLLRVHVEGSTLDTRFEQHDMWALKAADERPRLVQIFLYHGDFLTPGTASVRIKLEGARHAS